MTLTHWQSPNPLDALNRLPGRALLHNKLNQLFQAFGTPLVAEWPAPSHEQWLPRVDLYENKDVVTVQAQLPGFKREDLDISLQAGSLVLSGERKETRNPEASASSRTERAHGRFQRAIRLPYPVEAGAIKATYTDGILTVELPKAEAAKPRQIKISFN
jgi:HSP20 family protein